MQVGKLSCILPMHCPKSNRFCILSRPRKADASRMQEATHTVICFNSDSDNPESHLTSSLYADFVVAGHKHGLLRHLELKLSRHEQVGHEDFDRAGCAEESHLPHHNVVQLVAIRGNTWLDCSRQHTHTVTGNSQALVDCFGRSIYPPQKQGR